MYWECIRPMLGNPGKFCLWSLESWALESSSRNPESIMFKMRNPESRMQFSIKKTGIQYLESGIQYLECGIEKPKLSWIHLYGASTCYSFFEKSGFLFVIVPVNCMLVSFTATSDCMLKLLLFPCAWKILHTFCSMFAIILYVNIVPVQNQVKLNNIIFVFS